MNDDESNGRAPTHTADGEYILQNDHLEIVEVDVTLRIVRPRNRREYDMDHKGDRVLLWRLKDGKPREMACVVEGTHHQRLGEESPHQALFFTKQEALDADLAFLKAERDRAARRLQESQQALDAGLEASAAHRASVAER